MDGFDIIIDTPGVSVTNVDVEFVDERRVRITAVRQPIVLGAGEVIILDERRIIEPPEPVSREFDFRVPLDRNTGDFDVELGLLKVHLKKLAVKSKIRPAAKSSAAEAKGTDDK